MVKHIILFVIVGTLVACSTSPYTGEIATVDSLRHEIELAELRLDSVNNEQLSELAGNAQSQLAYIQKHFTDTMDKNLALMLGDYKRAYRDMEKLIRKVDRTEEELEESEEQLENLKADLENNLLNPSEVDSFLRVEHKIASKLVISTKKWPSANDAYIANYNRFYPKVDSLIDAMKRNGMR